MILLKIAFRNMREHRAKTLIVGALVTLGAFVLVAGNSFMDSVKAGQRRTFSENFTGDLIVRAQLRRGVLPDHEPEPERGADAGRLLPTSRRSSPAGKAWRRPCPL